MKSDEELGMHAPITRRDFIHDAALTALGLSVAGAAGAKETAAVHGADGLPSPAHYPPTRTGMRGSHPGSFEIAHAIAREGRSYPEPRDLDEEYDLVIVGAGISGLASAHYYRKRFGADARILLLDNHDDFGGHAKRNEFHQGGKMRLSLGGTHNLEWWKFSDTVKDYLGELDIDPQRMRDKMQFTYGNSAPNSPAMWFDEEHFGTNRLVTRCDFTTPGGLHDETIDQLPISDQARTQLKRFFSRRENLWEDLNDEQVERRLASLSYPDFLRRYGELGDEVIRILDKLEHGGWGVEMRALSARECLDDGYPGWHLLGGDLNDESSRYQVAMWPDGNASLARLQVATLIPDVAPGAHAENIALAQFDYSQLDRETSPVRLRLKSTVIDATNRDEGVAISYVRDGEVYRVRARHSVLACYHAIIPHICAQLPKPQQEALRYQVKAPLHLTNVLIRNTDALDRLGIDSVRCPGRLHSSLFTFRGINTGGYEHDIADTGPVSLVFWGAVSPPTGVEDVHDQRRASRALMLGMSLEDYEREVRKVLDGLLGPAGFDVKNDVLAITVNRWPHGYAYEYLDLWDPEYSAGEAPHEIARQPHGRIAIANSDAAADAYTHAAIDQAFRAVGELPG